MASVVNRHRVDDDPDPNFLFDADPRIGIKTMSYPKFYACWTIERSFTCIQRNASSQCFSFLSSGTGVMILSFLGSMLTKVVEKSKKITVHVLRKDADRNTAK